MNERIIYWVRSIGPGPIKDRVAMYYKGRKTRRDDEGEAGDIMARPVAMGPGQYTATYGGDAFENEDGSAF